jgi:phage-related protein
MTGDSGYKRQWRDYRTTRGGRPVYKFLMSLTSDERVEIVAAMNEVGRDGLAAARHLRGDIYEVKADTSEKFFRVLFATEGQFGEVLLSLEAFAKKTNKTPKANIEVAERRLKAWRAQGELLRKEQEAAKQPDDPSRKPRGGRPRA